ncbi:MAG TPA: citramalate synthase [Spirochaetota bacterium]|nr:citramalate synthase [Spirochaetota bacterium]
MAQRTEIIVYDTTLRDGAQSVGISFSLHDKVRIARELDRLKIDYIEGGWPGSNPKDDLFFTEIERHQLHHSRIAAFGSTKRPGLDYGKDELLAALAGCGAKTVTIVAKTWDFQVSAALKIEPKENIELIYGTVAYLKDRGLEVFLDAEHFFDGYRANPAYALEALAAAEKAGADMLVLCDTNGGTMVNDASEMTAAVVKSVKTPVGVHFHNDSGVAAANSFVAVQAGAVSVQGTMNGYGERCGNCDLTTIIPGLVLKLGYGCSAADSLVHLTEASRLISEIANLAHNERAPYVGDNAFAHKGGIHVSALTRDTRTYEHIDPEQVGNHRKVLISELAGKSNVEFKAREMGITMPGDAQLSKEILKKIKCMEDKGYQFEAAEGSFELIIRRSTREYTPFFILRGFRVITEKTENNALVCEATIKVEVDGIIEHTAANGNGPVDALDNALRKALEKFYPEIGEIKLTDYKVRVLNEKKGTGAAVRVLIDQSRAARHWGTVGVSENIIEASWQALVDGIEYMLLKDRLDGNGGDER